MADSKPYDEKRALELLAQGSSYAFVQIYDRYRPRIYRSAKRILHSSELAEEIVQEVFAKLWKKRGDLSSIHTSFYAYLFTMSRNLIYDHLKNAAEERAASKEYAMGLEHENSTDRFMLEQQYEELLNKAVDQLPPQQKQIFRLAKIDGLSQEAIAGQLNLTRLTVKTHMKKALQSIRLQLQGHITSFAVLAVLSEMFDSL